MILVSVGCRPEVTAPAGGASRTGTPVEARAGTPSPDAEQVTGPRYVFPLRPPGVADYSQGHHDYPATDIFAPPGTRFVAVTAGVIDEVSRRDRWTPEEDDPATRGGRFVSLIGDHGVRYYGAHLSSVAPGIAAGVRVETGTLLGRVGNSGNARGISPHLHFGISHPTFPGDWEVRRGEIDPYPYLQAWRAGVDRTPSLR